MLLRIITSLCLGLVLLGWTAEAAIAAKRVALVVGNASYPKAPLTNPKNDAEDVAASLKRLQFDVMERKDLTVAAFDGAVDEFLSKAKDADVALFFFSGHGLQIDRRGFLVPVDFKAESESSAFRELVPIQDVVSKVERAAKVSVVMLDACRDSPLQEHMHRIAREKDKSAVPAKGLPPMSILGSNTLVVYATTSGNVASDGVGRNSPFTAAFLRHVETPGLDIEVMFKDVTAEVLRETRGKQQPERYSRMQTRLELLPGSADEVEKMRKELAELRAKQSQPVVAASVPSTPPAAPADHSGKVAATIRAANGRDEQQWFTPGAGKTESFQDCINARCTIKGPEMVMAPAGDFMMGSPLNEADRFDDEGPQHKVTIGKPFAVGKYAVTFDDWDACVADGGCGGHKPSDQGWGRGDRPVVNVSWDDAQAYVKWLSGKTGKSYRLLSEAEREYVTRAGTTTPFWWGSSITPDQANYNGNYPYNGGTKGVYRQKTVPVNSFQPNPWGLYQVHGNVWEWVEDGWHDNYEGAPTDGSAWLDKSGARRALRGGSWSCGARSVRAARRSAYGRDGRDYGTGFRCARVRE